MSMPRMILATLLGLSFSWEMPVTVEAAAPQRTGQPYAEATLCARADVILCEDFNYPQNFSSVEKFVGNFWDTWTNPAVVKQTQEFQAGGQSRQINLATTYGKPALLPSGAQPDYAWAANWDATKGNTGHGATQGVMRNPGGSYANGMAPAKKLHFRFRLYWTPNYAWPGITPIPSRPGYSFCCNAVDNKILFVYPPECVGCTAASYDAGLYTHSGMFDGSSAFSDAASFRTGTPAVNYPWTPLGKENGAHGEYGPFASITAVDPHETPTLGKVFRFDRNRWYTVEFSYALSTQDKADGAIELWVDGVKVYDLGGLLTCGSAQSGDCSGIGAINLLAYHNMLDGTAWNGQQVVDDLVIATSYIGPSTTGSTSTPPPPAPTNLQVH